MMLVKIMDELNEKSAEKNSDEGNQKNIVEENVKRISGKKGDDLKQEFWSYIKKCLLSLQDWSQHIPCSWRRIQLQLSMHVEDSSITEE